MKVIWLKFTELIRDQKQLNIRIKIKMYIRQTLWIIPPFAFRFQSTEALVSNAVSNFVASQQYSVAASMTLAVCTCACIHRLTFDYSTKILFGKPQDSYLRVNA